MDDNKNKLSNEEIKEKIKDVFDKWEDYFSLGLMPEDHLQIFEEVLNCFNV